MAALTWDSFYDKIYKALQGEELGALEQKDNLRKLACLLQNFCGTLRSAMLAKENYRAITDTFVYKQHDAFVLFLEYLHPDELGKAREFVDRMYDRRQTQDYRSLRQLVIRKQNTVEGNG
jgi:hypothetical protein